MQTEAEKAKINRFLGSAGLGQLSDPGLISQIGFLAGRKIKGHDELRNWLNQCEPEERGNMLEALKPYLKFPPKPLDVYEAELGMHAEANQLPIWQDGKFRAFNPTRIEGENDEIAAIDPAIRGAYVNPIAARMMRKPGMIEATAEMLPNGEGVRLTYEVPNPHSGKTDTEIANEAISAACAKEHLRVLCSRCTREDVFHGWCRQDAVEKLRWWGWKLDPNSTPDAPKELCPKCAQ